MVQKYTTISDLRFKTKEVLKKADKGPVWLLLRSTPAGVILSPKLYEEIESVLEDYYLSLKAEGYEKEDKTKASWLGHSDVKRL